jgi:hypothetical protein
MRGLRGSKLAAVLGALALAIGLPGAPPPAVGAGSSANPSFCAPTEPLRDFGLSKLPPLREFPTEEQPSFVPPNVNVYDSGEQIVTGPTSFGYGFSEDNYGGTVKLDWTVTAQLWRVTRGGRPLRQVRSTTLQIGRLDAAHQPRIFVDLPGQRGFYRFDLQFSDREGKQLGAYGSYVRVVKPYWRARLGIERRSYRPGERVRTRVENYGSQGVAYGADFTVQRWEVGRWRRDRALTPGGFLLWLGILFPGRSSECIGPWLPLATEPGRYRILKSVGHPSDFEDNPRWLTAPFTVR